ncbi:MAG: ATP synthase F1 subunit delta [Bryobacteraceae bacterium]
MPAAVAARYARALVDVVLGAQSGVEPERVLAELRAFEQALSESAALSTILSSPAIAPARKRSVITKLAESVQTSRTVRNFLLVLIDHRRAAVLSEIISAFEKMVDERMGIVQVEVVSALPLSDRQKEALTWRLERTTGKKVWLNLQVNGELIGGILVRMGSTVYDGSVRGQLDTLGRRLRAQ